MGDINWIDCGSGRHSKSKSGVRVIPLDAVSAKPNVYLKIQNISTRLAKNLPPIVLDLLEIGSYVYAADQAVARGGKTLRGDGADWHRNFHFNIPVRNPGLWNSSEVKDLLRSTLSFLSYDAYEFTFYATSREPAIEQYFEFDDGTPWFQADEVALFSGGLDSFAGLCHTTIKNNRRIVLVSHRAAPQISKRQLELLAGFRNATGGRYEVLHVPVWVRKGESLTRDTNQRTRSFLFAILAASVAEMQGLDRISFYENGIVSFNLTPLEQVVGARATRTTHPRALQGLARLFSLVLGKDFKIESPFLWQTRTEIVESIIELGMADLIRSTNSCAHVRTGDPINTHCGVCSQCIDRRFAALHCGVTDEDPEEMYKVRLPLDPIVKSEDRTMTEAYVRFARELSQMTIDQFYTKYTDAIEVLPNLSLGISVGAQRLFELHQRHSQQVCRVLASQIRAHSEIIANGQVDRDSLLALIVDLPAPRQIVYDSTKRLPMIPGLTWEAITIELISQEAVRIYIHDFQCEYTAQEMGFRDRRRENALNQQWKLLVSFAEGGGVINAKNPQNKRAINKSFSDLRKALKDFFGLADDPIKAYNSKDGWVTRFKIFDRS